MGQAALAIELALVDPGRIGEPLLGQGRQLRLQPAGTRQTRLRCDISARGLRNSHCSHSPAIASPLPAAGPRNTTPHSRGAAGHLAQGEPPGGGSAPVSIAFVTAAVRPVTPSFPHARIRCVLTVASLTNRARPIWTLVSPRATRARTSVSLAESVPWPGPRTRETRRPATAGASTVSPLAAARMARSRSARGASLSR